MPMQVRLMVVLLAAEAGEAERGKTQACAGNLPQGSTQTQNALLHFHPRAAAAPQTDPKLTVYLSLCEIKASAQRRASLDRISATPRVKDAAVHP